MRALLTILLGLLICGCGYKPAYKIDKIGDDEYIYISKIENDSIIILDTMTVGEYMLGLKSPKNEDTIITAIRRD